jgi:hypothetical protein
MALASIPNHPNLVSTGINWCDSQGDTPWLFSPRYLCNTPAPEFEKQKYQAGLVETLPRRSHTFKGESVPFF